MNLTSQSDCRSKVNKARPVSKFRYECKAYIPMLGTPVYNKLEDVTIVTKKSEPVVIIGPAKEEYTVSLETLINNYSLRDDIGLNIEWLQRSGFLWTGRVLDLCWRASAKKICFALKTNLDNTFTITTAWNNVLKVNNPGVPHGTGDYIMFGNKNNQPDINDMWVVNGSVFKKTYQFI